MPNPIHSAQTTMLSQRAPTLIPMHPAQAMMHHHQQMQQQQQQKIQDQQLHAALHDQIRSAAQKQHQAMANENFHKLSYNLPPATMAKHK